MNYYIQGDAANADKIKAAFEKLGYDTSGHFFNAKSVLYFTLDGGIRATTCNCTPAIIKTHPGYKELELPVEPKFKEEDSIVNKSDKSTIYRIIDLHEERREYIVEIEHKDFHESCPWIAFEDQDDYELAPKPHYNISNFNPFDKVLVRQDDSCTWGVSFFGRYDGMFICCSNVSFTQCIPFEGNEHLLGTTDMPDEMYINW